MSTAAGPPGDPPNPLSVKEKIVMSTNTALLMLDYLVTHEVVDCIEERGLYRSPL